MQERLATRTCLGKVLQSKHKIDHLRHGSKSWGEFLGKIRTFKSSCVHGIIRKAMCMPHAIQMLRKDLRRTQSFIQELMPRLNASLPKY